MNFKQDNPDCNCCACGGCDLPVADEVDVVIPAGQQGTFGDCTDCADIAGTYRLTLQFTDASFETWVAFRFRSRCYWAGRFSTPFGAASDCIQGDMYVVFNADIAVGSGVPADYQGIVAVKFIGGSSANLNEGAIYGPNGIITANATSDPTDWLEDRDCTADGELTLTSDMDFAHDLSTFEFNPDCKWVTGDVFQVLPV